MPWHVSANGVRLAVLLNPNSAREEILGVVALADGKIFLKIKVRAVPEKGKANKAAIGFIAKQLGVAKSTFTQLSGATSRQKMFEISGESAILIQRLEALVA